MATMNKVNYQKELEKRIESIKDTNSRPKLLLHSCCAPCSSYCLLFLKDYFDITCFLYNPNITDRAEYDKRLAELERLASAMNDEYSTDIKVADGGYESSLFMEGVKGMEAVPEGGIRCDSCFVMRLDKAAEYCAANGFDCFTTTLTISPLKNATSINRIGQCSADKNNAVWLPSDFKKNGGYQESVRLSEKYGLYRQNYCGCVYSLRRDFSGFNNK